MRISLPDIDATRDLAHWLASELRDGDVLELVGEIGVGKTTFVQFLGDALGVREQIRSPTFTVAHRYEIDGEAGFLTHLDCYRAAEVLDDAAWGDVEPYFAAGIACVEWPEFIRPWLAHRPTWRLELATVAGATRDTQRIATVSAPADREVALSETLWQGHGAGAS